MPFLTDSTMSSSPLGIQLYIEVNFGRCSLLDTHVILYNIYFIYIITTYYYL